LEEKYQKNVIFLPSFLSLPLYPSVSQLVQAGRRKKKIRKKKKERKEKKEKKKKKMIFVFNIMIYELFK